MLIQSNTLAGLNLMKGVVLKAATQGTRYDLVQISLVII